MVWRGILGSRDEIFLSVTEHQVILTDVHPFKLVINGQHCTDTQGR
jgi:hypothetical protein